MGQYESESFVRFREIVPRNPFDWEGTVVLYSVESVSLFNVAFGTGDNLDSDDIADGFDDYIMVEQYQLDGTRDLEDILKDIRENGWIEDDLDGIREIDGGQLLLKRKEWNAGDIRRFIASALEFAGYGVSDPKQWMKDIVYVASDWNTFGLE